MNPAGVPSALGCAAGDVSVQVKAAHKTISTRRARLTTNCRFTTRVTFRSRKRFTKNGTLTFTASFTGNAVVRTTTSARWIAMTR